MMGPTQILLVLCCLSLFSALSASTFIADVVFEHQVVNERRILQVVKACPVNFENQNYSIITSRCKGPDYSPKPCCDAFKEFACPVADYINDLTSDCATRMFSYIGKIGKYPNGLFASLCREGKAGLACPAVAPPPPPLHSSYNNGTRIILLQLLLIPLLCFLLES